MTSVRIGDVVSVRGGGTPRKSIRAYYGGGVPWVTPKDMKRWRIDSSEITLTSAGVENSPAKPVPSGSALVVVRSGVLKHTLPVAVTTAPVAVNQDMKALVPGERIDGAYLARMIKAAQPVVLGWVRATTADNFPISNLLDLEIHLPRIEEQRRIAAILDEADAIGTRRRRALAHFDALKRSTFDLLVSRTGLPSVSLGELVELRAGVGFPPSLQGRPTGDYPLAKVGDIGRVGRSSRDLITTADHYVDEADLAVLKMRPIPAGSVLFAKIGEAIRHNHRVITGRQMLIDNNAMAAIPRSPEIDTTFLFEFLRTVDFYRLASSTTVPSLRKSDLAQISVPVPTHAIREELHLRMAAIDAQRSAFERGSAADGELFDALQSRAFRGEL